MWLKSNIMLVPFHAYQQKLLGENLCDIPWLDRDITDKLSVSLIGFLEFVDYRL